MMRKQWILGWALLSVLTPLGCRSFTGQVLDSGTDVPLADQVASDVTSSQELPPQDTVKLCLSTATILARKGEDREAIALYEKARSIDPKQAHLARKLAVLYDRQGNFVKATEEFQKALAEEPKDANLHNDLGYSYFRRGRLDEAAQTFRKAVALDPKNRRAWTNLGLTLAQQGETEQSYQAFTRVVSPGQAWSNLGMVQLAQGKKEEARVAFQRAMQLEPELKLSREALTHLNNPTNTASTPPPQRLPGLRSQGAASSLRGQRSPRPVLEEALPSLPPAADVFELNVPSSGEPPRVRSNFSSLAEDLPVEPDGAP